MSREIEFSEDLRISMDRPEIFGNKGAISSNNFYATKAGLEILKKGGNAVDASVAISLVLGVVEPYHSGIGGGCFSLFYNKQNDSFHSIDARGVAPLKSSENMFLDDLGNIDRLLLESSGLSITTPSFYKAMDTFLKKYGTMDWTEVSTPAIELARNGFRCGYQYSKIISCYESKYNFKNHKGFAELYFKNNIPPIFGETIVNLELANTMEKVATDGIDAFYKGDICDDIINSIKDSKGILSKYDMENLKIREIEPVKGSYRGFDIISMAPPSSGGTYLIQMLNILENFNLKDMGHSSADSIHLIAEILKLMFSERSISIGDPDYIQIKLKDILSKDYAKELTKKINLDTSSDYIPDMSIASTQYNGGTSHFSVVDSFGNIVSQTQTIRSWWGSGIVPKNRGFVMNNTMSDFSAKVGHKTSHGLTYGEANSIKPGKTPLSSMTPTIIMKDNSPYLAIGAAGGPRILTTVLQAIINVLDFDFPIDLAIKSPFVFNISKELGLEMEAGFSNDTIKILKNKGHKIIPIPSNEVMLVMPNGIMCKDNLLYPCGTNRCDGSGGVLTSENSIIIDGHTFLSFN